MFDRIGSDLRSAARALAGRLRYATLVVLTIALGSGATTAIYSALRPVLFEPLPYAHGERLVVVAEQRSDGGRVAVNFATYRALAERSRTFDGLAVSRSWQPVLAGEAQPERLDAQRVSAGYFQVLGVAPQLGRDFVADDDHPHGARRAIISDGLWQRRYAGDRSILGREIRLDDERYTVIGVMAPGYENVLAPRADVWSPLQYDSALPPQGVEWGHHLGMIGRLAAGVGLEQARADLMRVLGELAVSDPRLLRDYGAPERFVIARLADDLTAGVRPLLYAVAGAALLLLLIACVNVANLMFARALEGRGELLLRLSLGASRGRLLRQVLLESGLLATLGGLAGFVLAAAGVVLLKQLAPAGMPRLSAIAIDLGAFGFAMGISLLCGVAVASLPAWRPLLADRGVGLMQRSPRVIGGQQRVRRVLVVTEVALALVLLVGAGLLLRSLTRLFAVEPGFQASGLLTLQVQTASRKFADDAVARRYFDETLAAVQRVPGVSAAAWTSQLPLSGELDEYGVQFETPAGTTDDGGYSAFRYAVSPGYLETMGIAVTRGSVFNAGDGAGATPVMLISESLARARFGAADPLGQRLHVGRRDLPWFTVVGVVADVKQAALSAEHAEAVYVPGAQWYFTDAAQSLVVRTHGNGMTLVPALQSAIWAVDRDQAIVRVAPMEQLLAATAAERRFALSLFELFGAVALALASIGIYGVLAAAVADRRQELGVRLALGAPAAAVRRLILRQGLGLMSQGIALGVLLALGLTRFLQSLLFQVEPTDATTFVAISALLLAVALLACWWPARRAAAIDPLLAMRNE